MKVSEISNEQKEFLLNQPHQLYVVDDLLNGRVGPYVSHLTFSNTTPGGNPGVALTISLATHDLYRVAKQIVESIESKKDEFAKEYSEFIK